MIMKTLKSLVIMFFFLFMILILGFILNNIPQTSSEPEPCSCDPLLSADDPLCCACPWNPDILVDDPDCKECPYVPGIWVNDPACIAPEPCPWHPDILIDDPDCAECPYTPGLWINDPTCVEPPAGDPCPWNPGLLAGDPSCIECPYVPGIWVNDPACFQAPSGSSGSSSSSGSSGSSSTGQQTEERIIEFFNLIGLKSTSCVSEWECSAWEACYEGVQKRTCEDKKECYLPTDIPDFNRYCENNCREEWECAWSPCEDGSSTPTCVDKNNCGTQFEIPKKVLCEYDGCVPNISCTEWSGCYVVYSLMDIESGGAERLRSVKSRVCTDAGDCVRRFWEEDSCSSIVDIYTKDVSECGRDYLEIFNKLDNQLIAKIYRSGDFDLEFNIDFIFGKKEDSC